VRRLAPPAAGGNQQGAFKTSDVEVRVDLVRECKQMYREAWRVDATGSTAASHGLVLKEAEQKSEPYLRNVAWREDLTCLPPGSAATSWSATGETAAAIGTQST